KGPLLAVAAVVGLVAVGLLVVLVGLGAWWLMKPGSNGTSAVANAASSDAAVVADVGVVPDGQPLRYRWKGGAVVYHVRAEVDRGDHLEIHEGNFVLNINPRIQRGLPGGFRQGTGTGFAISPDGYLLTCAHVVNG